MTAGAAQGRTLFAAHAASGLLALATFSGAAGLPLTAGLAALGVMVVVRARLEPRSLRGGWRIVGGLVGASLAVLAPAVRYWSVSSVELAGAAAVVGPPVVLAPLTSAVAVGLMYVFGVLAGAALIGRAFAVPGPFDAPATPEAVELSARLDLHESVVVAFGLAAALVGPGFGAVARGLDDAAALAGAAALLVAAAFTFFVVRWLEPKVRMRVSGPSWHWSRWAVLVGTQLLLTVLIWVGR